MMYTGYMPLTEIESLKNELKSLPSYQEILKKKDLEDFNEKKDEVAKEKILSSNNDENFNIIDYLESYSDTEEVSPYQGEILDGEPPPTTVPLTPDIFATDFK